MAEFVFTSPGIKFKETDISFVTRNVGITTLGLVGETLKGPAFEPIFVQDKLEFQKRFGAQSVKKFSANGLLQYQLPYAANSYLSESNQLYVTRVLGLSGFNAGTAWALTLNAGLDPSTVIADSGNTRIFNDVYSDYVYMGVTLTREGDTGVAFSGFNKYNDTSFSGTSYNFIVTSTGNTDSGTVAVTATTLNGTEYTDYKNMVLAQLRSRGRIGDKVNASPISIFNTNVITMSGNTTNIGTGDLFGNFVLHTVGTNQTGNIKVSLNPNSSNYLPNVTGVEQFDKTTMIFTEFIYPDLIKKIDEDGDEFSSDLLQYGVSGISPYGYGVNSKVHIFNSTKFSNYNSAYKTPETPWVVSQVKGNTVDRLFKFISISDGNSANQEIKISITNINLNTLEFDVIIRDFNDTDDNINILESFTKCNLIESTNNYIGRRIGTINGFYNLNSKYVMVETAENINPTDFPAGFEGYIINDYVLTGITSGDTAIAPKIFYKQNYTIDDKIKKTYLGISEKAYNSSGINQNLFNFNGVIQTNTHTKTKGFHLDIDASDITSNDFTFITGSGKIQTIDDVEVDVSSTYNNILTRKFTLVPAGGFDGWNAYRRERSYGDEFKLNGIYDGVPTNGTPKNDYQAWSAAINTFANPEEIYINLFATPGINWSDQQLLIKDTIEMIETQRTDSLYVIDAPDTNITLTVGDTGRADVIVAEDIVDLLNDSDIDTSYACTYYPWIQINDTQNNLYVYIPPTGEILKAFAYTDNKAFTWYATAGLERGAINAKKSKYKLSEPAKNILYEGRINPIVDYPDTGTAIMGQKTLQVKASKLDRINVRRLILRMKVILSNIAIRLLFDPNDNQLIDKFKEKANPAFDSIVRNRGLEDYYFKMDSSLNTPETRDRNELYGQVFIKPIGALEFIGIEFVITPTGASFSK